LSQKCISLATSNVVAQRYKSVILQDDQQFRDHENLSEYLFAISRPEEYSSFLNRKEYYDRHIFPVSSHQQVFHSTVITMLFRRLYPSCQYLQFFLEDQHQ